MILGKPTPHLETNKPTNLTEWLDVATRNLVPSAQARVLPEIETHYAEAVQAKVERGWPEAEAQAMALAGLGDARVAARRFSQEHLTNWDAKFMTGWTRGQIFVGTIWIVGNAVNVFPTGSVGLAGALLLLLSVYLIHRAFGVLVRRSRQVVSERLIFLLVSLSWLNVGGFISMNHLDKSSDQVVHVFRLLITVCFIIQTGAICFGLHQMRKKLASTRGDGPPPHTPSAA